jgi:hypothetical protein
MSGSSMREVRVYIVVGVALVALGCVLLFLDHTWQTAEGRITAVEARHSDNSFYTVYVQYDYLVGGTTSSYRDWCAPPQFVTHTTRGHAQQIASGIRIGDAIPIFYDPRSPEHSGCVDQGHRFYTYLGFCVFGFALVPFFAARYRLRDLRFMREMREQREAQSAATAPGAPSPREVKARQLARALVSDVRLYHGDAIVRLVRLGKEIQPSAGLDPDPSVAADQKAIREAIEEARRQFQSRRWSAEWPAVFEEEMANLYSPKLFPQV